MRVLLLTIFGLCLSALSSNTSAGGGCALGADADYTGPGDQCFILVGISGYGTGEDGRGQPSGAHDNLPQKNPRIAATFKLTHKAKRKNFDSIIENFQCEQGSQGATRLGLVIMANSWGAGKAEKFARAYEQSCGRKASLVVMVDGVGKPLYSFKKRPASEMCVNYYQTRSTIHGGPIEGCENINLGGICLKAGLADCHIAVEWDGTARGAATIEAFLRAARPID